MKSDDNGICFSPMQLLVYSFPGSINQFKVESGLLILDDYLDD